MSRSRFGRWCLAPISLLKISRFFHLSVFAEQDAVGHCNQLRLVSFSIPFLKVSRLHLSLSNPKSPILCFKQRDAFLAGRLTWWSGMDAVDPEDLDVGFSIKSILTLGAVSRFAPGSHAKKVTRISLAISKINSKRTGRSSLFYCLAYWMPRVPPGFRF